MKRCKSNVSLGLALTCILSAPLALAQQQSTDELKKDIESLKEGQKAIQKDIQEIKALLQKGQPAPQAQIDQLLAEKPKAGAEKPAEKPK